MCALRKHTNSGTAIHSLIKSDVLKEHIWVQYIEEKVISDVETKKNLMVMIKYLEFFKLSFYNLGYLPRISRNSSVKS